MREEAVHFGATDSLVGIVTTAAEAPVSARPAFIFLNSGLTPRMGPHRLHVTMARELAALGLTSFRIDLSGIGDSPPSGGTASLIDRWTAETREAMDFLKTTQAVERFVLVGNCSGAGIAMATAALDDRVCGTALINLQGPVPYLRYYLKLLTKPASWRRLFAGTMRYQEVLAGIRERIGRLTAKSGQTSEEPVYDVDAALEAIARHRTRLLLVFSYWDPSLDFFHASLKGKVARLFAPQDVETCVVPGMNHDFTLLHGQRRLRQVVRDWASTFGAVPVPGGRAHGAETSSV